MNAKPQIFIESLPMWADQYIQVCISHTKQVVSGSGKVIMVSDRHIPTISYFLNIWLPMLSGLTIVPKTYYEWLHNTEDELKSNTIKTIDEKFKALAADIVANEQKGIFYAKNKLGWTDRQHMDSSVTVTALPININSIAPPLADDEK